MCIRDRQKNLVIELYEEDETAAKPGAIDHVALDVTDVERTFELVGALGYEMLDTCLLYTSGMGTAVRGGYRCHYPDPSGFYIFGKTAGQRADCGGGQGLTIRCE